MTIERNPVPGSTFPRPLGCIDVDPKTGLKKGSKCEEEYLAVGKKGEKFRCPRGCDVSTYLYPRRQGRTKPGQEPYFHFHQGIDLGAREESPIISVSDGVVIVAREWDGESAGYGTVVAVYSEEHNLTFWYAHCHSLLVKVGDDVVEQQQIARVGNTGKAGNPHLHFEVRELSHPLI